MTQLRKGSKSPEIRHYNEEVNVRNANQSDIEEILKFFYSLKFEVSAKGKMIKSGLVKMPASKSELKKRIRENLFLLATHPQNKSILGLLEAKWISRGIKNKAEFIKAISKYTFDSTNDRNQMLIKVKSGHDIAILEQLGVRNRHRLKGIASRLMFEMLIRTPKDNLYSVFTEVLTQPIENELAFKFYCDSMGFSKIGEMFEDVKIDGHQHYIKWTILEWFRHP